MSEVCVRVAVRIRPLLPKEVLHQHEVCVRVVPGSAQVKLGSDRLFSFDHAFGPTASQDEVYQSGVLPLVESLVDGYNATVFCYGQTGSGKTYTLGGGNQDEEGGIIDRVAQDLFLLVEKRKHSDGLKATVRVSYLELYREELRDLLELQMLQKELHIREDEKGNTVVVGVREMVITSAEELLSVIEMGNALRHTGVTGMNERSSRSHTILTLQVNVCCPSNKNSSLKPVRSSKICLVDLAGTERAGKTGNTGTRLKESAHINTGLLALGNVIRALSDHSRNLRGNSSSSAHIPYRHAKLTRLLRDSLGGNAHTLMVACVSPSHTFVTETLNVLQFATKVRHIRNCPGATSAQTETQLFPNTWDPADARLEELEYEVKTLRELLKEKEKDVEMEREKTGSRGGEDDIKQSNQLRVSEPHQMINQETARQFCLLAQEAAALLEDITGPSPSLVFKQKLQDWKERLTAVSQSHQQDDKPNPEGCRDQPHHLTLKELRGELYKCQYALRVKEQMMEEKDVELKKNQKEVEALLEEKRTQLLALEKGKERIQMQMEELVNQQMLIDRLRSNLMTFHGTTSGATVDARTSGYLYKRPHSVPLIRHSCVSRSSRKIHSSPPTYSLERVMAAYAMHGHLLLAEMEEKDEVCCPFFKEQATNKLISQEEEEDSCMSKMKFRRFLNRTWTSQQKWLPPKERSFAPDQMHVGNEAVQQSQHHIDTMKNQPNQSRMKKGGRTGATQRRIHELTVNMRIKEELIKELDKTEKETQAVDRHVKLAVDGGEVDVLKRLSAQSQLVRADVYHSLQHMRLQRAELRSSLRQKKETSDGTKETWRQSEGNSAISKSSHQEESNRMLCGSSWLDEEEERVLQKRAELQELEEELKRREEVLLHRETCLQQKNKLEMKILHSSQVLSQDLLHVSMQLESVEEQLQSSNNSRVRKPGGLTKDELEEERDLLRMKRDALNAQLRDNRGLTAEEEHSLLQLEEAIEALDAALEFKNQSIEDKKQLLDRASFLHQSQSTEPTQHCGIIRKLEKLSPPEALELLVSYFNKVVCLREVERHLRLRCDELELQTGEQEAVLRNMEAAMQHLTLDADRRITQLHRDHQNNIQLLLQKLKEGVSGEAQQAIQDRLQHLEKELFFYKSSSRQLKKKLKEILTDDLHPDNQPSHTQEHKQTHSMQIHMSANTSQAHSEDIKESAHIKTSYTKIYLEQTDARMSEHKQILTQSHKSRSRGPSEESLEFTPVRLRSRELRQISPADLQLFGSVTRRQQAVVDASTESVMEDSIEVSKNTDR